MIPRPKDDPRKVFTIPPTQAANDAVAQPQPAKKWRRVTINWKTLICALAAEVIIVVAILVVNWAIAERGDTGERLLFGKSAFWFSAMAGAFAMATCELVRSGLVFLGAVHRRRAVRGLMLIGALLSVFVTTKSMSVVYEQLFANRLREVVATTMAVDKAKAQKETLEAKLAGPKNANDGRKTQLARLDAQLTGLPETLKQFGPPPKPVTTWVSTRDRSGRVIGKRPVTTTPPWSGATMQGQYIKTQDERDKQAKAIAQGEIELSGIASEVAQAAEIVTAAESRRREAIAASQMHSYAAMIFLKSPHDVTDREVHAVLLVFVLLAAFATAIAASLAVYGSFTRYPATDEPRVDGRPTAVVITPTLSNWFQRLATQTPLTASHSGATERRTT